MKASRKSAGILLYRFRQGYEFFLVHPGGPFWVRKDIGVWSIPKGEFGDEDPELAARREFAEETGTRLSAPLFFVGTSVLRSGKTIFAFAGEDDIDAASLKSNLFPLEWPPRSGKTIMVPEVDRGAWMEIEEARKKIHPGQLPLLEKLHRHLVAGKQ